MPLFASVIASIGLVLSGWLYAHPVEQTHALGASQTISSLTALTSPVDADMFAVVDTTADPDTTKKMTFSSLRTKLVSDWDSSQWMRFFSTSTGLRNYVSDETGTGALVFATSSVLETPRINVGSDATGDLYYRNSLGGFTRLPFGSQGYILTASTTGLPSWESIAIGNLFTASTTFNATTTIQADSLTNRAFVARGLAYTFPPNRSGSSSSLLSDASGNLYWDTPLLVLGSSTAIFASSTVDGTINEVSGNIKVKEFTMPVRGCGWIGFDVRNQNNTNGHARVYINEVAYGVDHTYGDTGVWHTIADGFCAELGNRVQIYLNAGSSNNINYRLVQYHGTLISTTTANNLSYDI